MTIPPSGWPTTLALIACAAACGGFADPARAVTQSDRSILGPLQLGDPAGDGPLQGPLEFGFDDEMVVPDVSGDAFAQETILTPPSLVDTSTPGASRMLLEEFPLERYEEMPALASSGSWFWNGGWYVGGESLWFDRSRNNRRVFIRDVPVTGPFRFPIDYTTGANQWDIAPGGRVTIGRALGRDDLDRDRFFEFIWYGGFNWEDNAGWNTIPGGIFITPRSPEAWGFNGATRVETANSFDFNSWEFNYKIRRRLGRDHMIMSPSGSWAKHAERGWLPALLVGVRFAHANEYFSMLTTRPGTAPADFSGLYNIGTSNWLLGLNLGTELISQSEFFYWGLRGRVTPSLSFASQRQAAAGVDAITGPVERTAFTDRGSQNFAGFIGDLTLLAGFHITPNFAFQTGYDFLWLAGIATTERQYNINDTAFNDIDAGGQALLQGLSFGFYGSW